MEALSQAKGTYETNEAMRYDYVCDECDYEEVHTHSMGAKPTIPCPECGAPMRISIQSTPDIYMGIREMKHRDRPSNAEYRAYRRYEKSGHPDDRKRWLEAKGETDALP